MTSSCEQTLTLCPICDTNVPINKRHSDCQPRGPSVWSDDNEESSDDLLQLVLTSNSSSPSSSSTIPYYLAYFKTILRAVFEETDDGELFLEREAEIVHKTFNRTLSDDAKRIYVRLFQRKLAWIPIRKIQYSDDVSDLQSALDELVRTGFLLDNSKMQDLEQVLNRLLSPQLKDLAKEFKISKSTKSDIIQDLLKLAVKKSMFTQATLEKKIFQKAYAKIGACFRLNEDIRKIFTRVIMLYSLPHFYEDRDPNKSLTTILLTNRGKFVYPQYDIIRSAKVFRHRDDVMKLERILEWDAEMTECYRRKDFLTVAKSLLPSIKKFYEGEILGDPDYIQHSRNLPDFLRKFTAGSFAIYLLSKCVDALEKIRDYGAAVVVLELLVSKNQIYLSDYLGHWYERLSLDLEQRLKQPEEAIRFIREALIRVPSKPRKLGLCQRVLKIKLCKRTSSEILHRVSTMMEMDEWIDPDSLDIPSETIRGQLMTKGSNNSNSKSVFIRELGDGERIYCSVEELVREHFKSEYPQGLHSEGAVVHSVVFVIFWDLVYDLPVPDAFRFPNQTVPLDLDSNHFYSSRKTKVDERLQWIIRASDSELKDLLQRHWEKGEGITSSLVTWTLFASFDSFFNLVQCFTRIQLMELCRRLITEHRYNRSGFPDLTVWNPITQRILIIEVKGPGDRLSFKQILWIDFLKKLDIPVIACYVEPLGSKRALHDSYKNPSKRAKEDDL